MILFLLCCLWGGEGSAWRSGEHLLLDQNAKDLRYTDLSGAKPERTYAGALLALCRKGAVLRLAQGCVWLDFASGELSPLGEPPGSAVPLALTDVDGPALITPERFLVWRAGQWRSLPLPVWYETSAPRPVPGSKLGHVPIWPRIFDQGRGKLWLYQPKSGKLTTYDPQTKNSTSANISTKLVPIPQGGNLLWIGLPEDDHLALSGSDPAAPPIAHVQIDNLSEHSLVLPSASGVWLLTFASGLRDGLRSWDRGTVRITAVFARAAGRRLNVQSFDLGELPVSFALNTSASGSPKLAVTPMFTPTIVQGRDRLAIIRDKGIDWLDPSGKRGSLSLSGKGKPLALAARPNGVEVYEATRHYLLDWGKQP